jgi:hypothetical protein
MTAGVLATRVAVRVPFVLASLLLVAPAGLALAVRVRR